MAGQRLSIRQQMRSGRCTQIPAASEPVENRKGNEDTYFVDVQFIRTNISSLKKKFLVCYDYGMGGLWGYMYSLSAQQIREKYPGLRIYTNMPRWLEQSHFKDFVAEHNEFDIEDEPRDFLIEAQSFDYRANGSKSLAPKKYLVRTWLGHREVWYLVSASGEEEIRSVAPFAEIFFTLPRWMDVESFSRIATRVDIEKFNQLPN